jgi:hypothetical protein
MRIHRACKISDLNWGAVPELVNRLERHNFKIETIKGEISRYPDTITINNIDEFVSNIRENGPPPRYDLSVDGKVDDVKFYFSLSRGWNIHRQHYLYIMLDAPSPLKPLESVMELLGLTPDQEACIRSRPEKTAFIAHRFDNVGNDLADKLARFLELLGFSVATGRGFSPTSIAEKVKKRIEEKAMVLVILTPGSDDTWLIQESILGSITGKPIIILKDTSSSFKAGILSDLEYIPFISPDIESCFIAVLEGLRELGYFE